MTRRSALAVETASVPARLTPGKSRWMLLTCEHGHLIRNIPFGEWSDARKRFEQEGATVECGRCVHERS